jgi:hypothetical protein
VDYACRDDYGTSAAQTSAWYGLHYFASRHALGEQSLPLLTWPEGNARLSRGLRTQNKGHILTEQQVCVIEPLPNKVRAWVWQVREQRMQIWEAERLIYAGPLFLLKHLLRADNQTAMASAIQAQALSYAPWLVANLSLHESPRTPSAQAALCWDNVFYQSPSLGYVVANHQHLRGHLNETVLTYYRPFAELAPKQARQQLLDTSQATWVKNIMDELGQAHPEIVRTAMQCDVWRWGHAMRQPHVGTYRAVRQAPWVNAVSSKNTVQITPRLLLAHSDLSGYSIFEEANYWGVEAARGALGRL